MKATTPARLLISDPIHIRIIRLLNRLPDDEVAGVAEALEECVRSLPPSEATEPVDSA